MIWTPTGCARPCTRWWVAIRIWRHGSSMQFGEPVQVIPVEPQIAWRQVAFDTDVEQRVEQLCAAERVAV